MYKREPHNEMDRMLAEGEIPYHRLLCLIDGRFYSMYEDTYMIYKANDPEFVKKERGAKRWLTESLKDSKPEACIECACSYNWKPPREYGKCTLDQRLRIHDEYTRHKKCPLLKRED